MSDGLSIEEIDKSLPEIVHHLRSRGVGHQSFADYAGRISINRARLDISQPIGPYLRESLRELQKLRAVGRLRAEQIATNLAVLARHLGWEPVVSSPLDDLRSVGVPEDFPVTAMFFSSRARSGAKKLGLHTAAELYGHASDPRWKTQSRLPNFRRKSIDEILQFVDAIKRRDKNKVREFVPIRLSRDGIDIGLAAKLAIGLHPTPGLDGMYARLVSHRTLNEIARGNNRSRERIRQVQVNLIDVIRATLDATPELRQRLWSEWCNARILTTIPSDEDERTRQIAAEAVAKIFSQEPGGRELLARKPGDTTFLRQNNSGQGQAPEESPEMVDSEPAATPPCSDFHDPPPRIKTITNRIIRDTELARRIKQEHGYRCQLCNSRITLPNGTFYAEAHHIIPLGKPDNGKDQRPNIICVCPNHHAELDYGVIKLDKAMIRSGANSISSAAINYHNQAIFGKVRRRQS